MRRIAWPLYLVFWGGMTALFGWGLAANEIGHAHAVVIGGCAATAAGLAVLMVLSPFPSHRVFTAVVFVLFVADTANLTRLYWGWVCPAGAEKGLSAVWFDGIGMAAMLPLFSLCMWWFSLRAKAPRFEALWLATCYALFLGGLLACLGGPVMCFPFVAGTVVLSFFMIVLLRTARALRSGSMAPPETPGGAAAGDR